MSKDQTRLKLIQPQFEHSPPIPFKIGQLVKTTQLSPNNKMEYFHIIEDNRFNVGSNYLYTVIPVNPRKNEYDGYSCYAFYPKDLFPCSASEETLYGNWGYITKYCYEVGK